jgi:hypothetical protein
MNLERIYNDFIQSRRLIQHALVVYETHHVVPRSLGGTDAPDNLIKLSHGDHLFGHLLLAKIHGGPMVSAFVLMLDNERYAGRHSRLKHADLRRAYAQRKSVQRQGQRHSDATIEKITIARRQRGSTSVETRAKISASKRGIKPSETTRAKLSAARAGKSRGPCPAERRAKISMALTGRKGHPCSEEHKDKLRTIMLKRHSNGEFNHG